MYTWDAIVFFFLLFSIRLCDHLFASVYFWRTKSKEYFAKLNKKSKYIYEKKQNKTILNLILFWFLHLNITASDCVNRMAQWLRTIFQSGFYFVDVGSKWRSTWNIFIILTSAFSEWASIKRRFYFCCFKLIILLPCLFKMAKTKLNPIRSEGNLFEAFWIYFLSQFFLSWSNLTTYENERTASISFSLAWQKQLCKKKIQLNWFIYKCKTFVNKSNETNGTSVHTGPIQRKKKKFEIRDRINNKYNFLFHVCDSIVVQQI